jgi:hypothetical protein
VRGLLLEDRLPDLASLDDLPLGKEIVRLAEVRRVGIWRHKVAQLGENSSMLRTNSMNVLFPQVNS